MDWNCSLGVLAVAFCVRAVEVISAITVRMSVLRESKLLMINVLVFLAGLSLTGVIIKMNGSDRDIKNVGQNCYLYLEVFDYLVQQIE